MITNSETTEVNQSSQNKVVFYAIQLVVLSIVLVKCFYIIEPFINILIWSAIFGITLQPLHSKLSKKLKGKKTLAAVIISTSLLLLILLPSIWLFSASIEEFKILKRAAQENQINFSNPDERIKEIPIIGKKIYTTWSEVVTEKSSYITKHSEDLKPIALKIISLFSTVGKGILLILGAIIISGILLVYSEPINNFSKAFFIKIAGSHGHNINSTITSTIKNVAKGILGVSFLQSSLLGIGLLLAGIPFAGLWAIISLLLAIVQVGILPVVLGVLVYVWTGDDTLTAVLLTIWLVFLTILDNVLKPILMGKGASVPMLVIFIGTIGGFIVNGFVGLFTGAIILSITYNLIISWVNYKPLELEEELLENEPILENDSEV